MKFTRCGLDIAKQVFQVHGVNEHGVVKERKTRMAKYNRLLEIESELGDKAAFVDPYRSYASA
jgi:transposase